MSPILKRKRSDSEISTTSSLLSSPLSNPFMNFDSFQSQQQIPTPSLFASRTRKRHRDNRPSQADVHRKLFLALSTAELLSLTLSPEHTLSLLFSAQNSHSQPQSFIQQTQQAPIAPVPMNTESGGHQSSLHSFFTIPSARQSSPSSLSSNSSNQSADTSMHMATMPSLFQATNCDDCDVPLGQGGADGMDVDMMDVDVASGGNYACEQCGRMVCHGCAVSNLGQQRRCLNCAGRRQKVWVGGLGWV